MDINVFEIFNWKLKFSSFWKVGIILVTIDDKTITNNQTKVAMKSLKNSIIGDTFTFDYSWQQVFLISIKTSAILSHERFFRKGIMIENLWN